MLNLIVAIVLVVANAASQPKKPTACWWDGNINHVTGNSIFPVLVNADGEYVVLPGEVPDVPEESIKRCEVYIRK